MTSKKTIPAQTIGVLGEVIPKHYSGTEIDNLFLRCGAPEKNQYSYSNKTGQVQTMLRTINDWADQPLEILGSVIEDLYNKNIKESSNYRWGQYNSDQEATSAFDKDKVKIQESLTKAGLQYSGGHILHGGAASPTLSLKEYVSKNGLKGVEEQINRALNNVETDPPVALSAAGNILEAVFKNYLEHHKVAYSDKDTLDPLWDKVATHMDIRKKHENEEVAKVVSGLNKIVDGILHLRNRKSSAHGKSESQIKAYTILPRHARLAIHSAHTISAYLLELIESGTK